MWKGNLSKATQVNTDLNWELSGFTVPSRNTLSLSVQHFPGVRLDSVDSCPFLFGIWGFTFLVAGNIAAKPQNTGRLGCRSHLFVVNNGKYHKDLQEWRHGGPLEKCFTMKEKFRAQENLANRKLICLMNFCPRCLILRIICESLYQSHLYYSLLSYGCKIYFLLSKLIRASLGTNATLFTSSEITVNVLLVFFFSFNELIFFFLAAHQGT